MIDIKELSKSTKPVNGNGTAKLTNISELMAMSNLSVVLTYHWFDEIKSGRKTHEYRERSLYWANKLEGKHYDTITFQRGYIKNAEKMTFEVISITKKDGQCPHLPDVWDYWDIELGKRIENFNK